MKKLLRIIYRFFLILLGTIASFVMVVTVFISVSPQFGQSPEGADLERMKQSPHYKEDGFVNLIETRQSTSDDMLGTIIEFLTAENLDPKDTIPVKFGENQAQPEDTLCYITWYGHSAFLFEMAGKRILIDPMLTETAAPVSFGSKRYPYEKPIPIDELTDIDALILSHDHYDHLDYPTVMKLKKEVKHFYTALGVGSHLKSWDVPEENITELDWWDSVRVDDLTLHACPSRHFSGRGITDGNKTEWASWVISGPNQNIYFSGDGGYGPHFSEIGERLGPFDLALLECGQYNEAWSEIHMMPEESVQAGMDVKASIQMPIHWGAFTLAIHEWTDPIKRFKAAAIEKNINMIHPYIGERFSLGQDFPKEEWWLEASN